MITIHTSEIADKERLLLSLMAKTKEKRKNLSARKGGSEVGATKTKKKNSHGLSQTPDRRLLCAALLAIFLASVAILF
eukprot:scaffold6532_cov47-Cyclotella_meneghiniana.AAC.1